MVFNRKGISPVVATALLLVVAVVAVVGFQTWFQSYQSSLQAKTEQQSNTGTPVTVERLGTDSLYLKNWGTTPINVTEVTVDGFTCDTDYFTLPASSVTNVYNATYANCSGTLTQGDKLDVIIVTSDGVYSETELVR